MLDRVHFEQALEAIGFGHGAEFLDVRHTIARELRAQRVHRTHIHECCGKQVGPLGHGAANGDAAGAATLSSEPAGRGVALLDEVFGTGDEVLPGVRLVELLPREMPALTQFATAAHMRNRVDAAAFEPRDRRGAEADRLADAVRAVGVKQRRVRAVELDALLVNDRQRHHHTIVARHLDFDRLESLQVVELADRVKLRIGELPRGAVVDVRAPAPGPR